MRFGTFSMLAALLAAGSASGTTTGNFALLKSFGANKASAATPGGTPLALKGSLYATTLAGGAKQKGTVLRITPGKTFGAAPAVTILYSFGAHAGDGTNPDGDLVADAQGHLYGTTETGGSGYGTVFMLTPPASGQTTWTETILYKFTGLLDGANPQGALTILPSGALLGGTPRGGKSGCNFAGCGAIWQLTPPATGTAWQFAILYNFTGGADGGTPIAAPVSHNGLLFGTTQFGGTAGDGVVYTLTPPASSGGAWTETVLHTFTGTPDGSGPLGQLLFDTAGNAYGTTLVGGDAQCVENPQGIGCGTVFRLSPPAAAGGAWTENQLYVFKGAADGANVDGKLVAGAKGAFYGSTIGNSDTIFGSAFALTPPATGTAYIETTLHAFSAIAGGAEPRGLASQAGNLFGLTQEGGTYGGGTAFELQP